MYSRVNAGKPYIGITDFATPDQVHKCLEVLTPHRDLHVGVMTSYKMITGADTFWRSVWPSYDQIKEIFNSNDPRAFNVVHYADYASESQTTADHLLRVLDDCGPNVHGIQLDMLWPNHWMVHELQIMRPDIEIIIQIGSLAKDIVPDNRAPDWKQWALNYQFCSYILLDTGMGRGTEIDQLQAVEEIEALRSELFRPDQIAVAGGFSAQTAFKMVPILNAAQAISCDAQSKLRPSHSAKDPLDIDMAVAYVEAVSAVVDAEYDKEHTTYFGQSD